MQLNPEAQKTRFSRRDSLNSQFVGFYVLVRALHSRKTARTRQIVDSAVYDLEMRVRQSQATASLCPRRSSSLLAVLFDFKLSLWQSNLELKYPQW
uniref:Uncharacterized protein n=1 Tax=Toxoplasma gondii COUG TaxID=1074873 RepID=A0A2G8Y312_TOXGO|nr:hypothetical protein TGCOUG_272645 [Toxoplasma gondii COUG]